MWQRLGMLLNEGDAGGSGAATAAPAGSSGSTPTTGGGGSTATVHEIVVNGKKLSLTTEELVRRAQKVENAEQKTQEAVERMKEYDALKRFQDDAKAAVGGDEEAFRRYGKEVGLDPRVVESTLSARIAAQIRQAVGTEDDDDDTEGDGGGGMSVDAVAAKVAEKLFPAIKAQMSKMKVGFDNLDDPIRHNLSRLVGKDITGNVSAVLDNDPYFGKFLKKASDSQKKAVQARVAGEVRRRVREGFDLADPEQVTSLLQEMRSEFEAFGIRPLNDSTPFAGLGSHSQGYPNLHLSSQPMARPKDGMADLKYEQYVGDKIVRKLQDLFEAEG